MNHIDQTSTFFSCQYFVDSKKILLKTPSRHVDDYFSVIGAEYSEILDGYIIDTDKVNVNIIELHQHIIESMRKKYETIKNENYCGPKRQDTIMINKLSDSFSENCSHEMPNSEAIKIDRNISRSIQADEKKGCLVQVKGKKWVIYLYDDIEEQKIKDTKFICDKKVEFDTNYCGFMFQEDSKKATIEKIICNLETDGFEKANGIFYYSQQCSDESFSTQDSDKQKTHKIEARVSCHLEKSVYQSIVQSLKNLNMTKDHLEKNLFVEKETVYGKNPPKAKVECLVDSPKNNHNFIKQRLLELGLVFLCS